MPVPTILLVGGKGGVGKTTCAAALALGRAARGERTLVLSTDPAPSLGDALDRRLSSTPRRVPIRDGVLHASELDARVAIHRWLRGRRAALESIVLRGSWLDHDDVAALLGRTLPGVDEIAALLEIARLRRHGRFDTVVVDSAPTGHTLRTLAMPQTVSALAAALDRMQAKHRAIAGALGGRWRDDAAELLIQEIDSAAREMTAMLQDRAACEVTLVTLPEPMAIAETLDAAAQLGVIGITVARVVVNRVTPAPSRPCRSCDGRRIVESRAIRLLRRSWTTDSPVEMVPVSDADVEPRGEAALRRIGRQIDLRAAAPRPPSRPAAAVRPPSRRAARFTAAVDGRPASDLWSSTDLRLLVWGGKGGVGKTTCAAAAAIDLAGRFPNRRVLLLSVDPAHSLADVLGTPVTDTPRPLPHGPQNLRVRELDAPLRFDRLRAGYAEAIDALFTKAGSGISTDDDRRVMRDLLELAPPGLDELVAILDVTDAVVGPVAPADAAGRDASADAFDLVVIDTAPTGHALRLLETPAVVQAWVQTLMRVLLKYQAVANIGELGGLLLRVSQALGRLRELLTDRTRAEFVAVTRAAALPRAETLRLRRRLRRLGIHAPMIVINAVGGGNCARCVRRRRAERREIEALRLSARLSPDNLVFAPATMPPPHGVAALRRWRTGWGIS